MPEKLNIACPTCGKELNVPAEYEGKRVKCKGCQEVFPIKAPKPAGKKTAAKPDANSNPKPAPAPAPEKPKSPFLDDDDDAKAVEVVLESDTPRCPQCTEELDPPDAVVCRNCGFNNLTRVRNRTKKTIEADAREWTEHLAPGIGALCFALFALIFDIVCMFQMRNWMTGSILEKDGEKTMTGEQKFYVIPWGMSVLITALSLLVIIPCLRYAYRRLAVEYQPEEHEK